MNVIRGLTYVISKGAWVSAYQMSDGFKHIATGSVLGVSNPIIIAVVIYLAFFYFINHMRTGRQIYAVGSNPEAADISGIPRRRIIWLVYTVMGALAGLGGVIWVAKFASAQSDTATGFELNVIAATVLGGVSIAGGSGKVSGLILGTILLGILEQRPAPHQRFPVLAAGHPGDRDPRRRAHQRAGQEKQPALRAAAARHLGRRRGKIHSGRQAVELARVLPPVGMAARADLHRGQRRQQHALSLLLHGRHVPPDTPMSFLDKAFLVLPMTMVIILGNIDISVGSTVALSAVVMAVTYQRGPAHACSRSCSAWRWPPPAAWSTASS